MSPRSNATLAVQALPEPLLDEVRAQFHHVDVCPITKTPRIFFESGGGSLKLKAACARSAEVSTYPDQEGRDNDASRHLSAIGARGIADLELLMGASSGIIITGETGTNILYRLARSVALSAPPGPFVSCTLEHPASLCAAHVWARNTGREWIEVPFDAAAGTVTARAYGDAMAPDTRLVTITHTSQLTGLRVDLEATCAAIRAVAPDCFIVVDGIQHAPHGALSVDDYGADAYVIAPYKTYSRVNSGFAWISDRLARVPHDNLIGAEEMRWHLGTRDLGLHAAQSEVVAHFCWLGAHFTESVDPRARLLAAAHAMAAHEAYLIDLVLHGEGALKGLARDARIQLIGPDSLDDREGIVSFTVKGRSSPELVREFAARGIRLHARTNDIYSGHILRALGLEDCLRISLCYYTSPQEVRTFLKVLNEIAG